MAAIVKIQISQEGGGNAAQQAKKDIEELGQTAEKAGGGFSALHEIGVGALRELGAVGLNVLGSLAGKFASFVSDGISDAREAAKIMAQTEAVIKSTGGAAGVSAQHVADLASSLSAAAGKSLFGDDQVQQSENMLLTFTNVKGAVLDTATAISVDMAQALGGAPKDNAIQLGKALNDPVKGITALTRVGVTFSEEQKDMIQAMVDTGNTAGAQQVILAELSKEFGGSAEAAAKADGGMAQLKDQLGELGEGIGTALLPIINQFVGFLITSVMPVVQQAAGKIEVFFTTISDAIATSGDWSSSLGETIGFIIDQFTGLFGLTTDFQSMGASISGVFAGLVDTWTMAGDAASSLGEQVGIFFDVLISGWDGTSVFQDGIPVLQGVLAGLYATFTDASNPIQGFINVLSQVSPGFQALVAIVQAVLPSIQSIVQSVFDIIGGVISGHGAQMLSDVQGVWNGIHDVINAILPPIQSIIQSIFGAVATFIQNHGTEIQGFITTTWDAIIAIINTALALIKAILVPALTAIAGFLQAHGDQIQTILTTVWDALKAIVDGALTLIKGILTAALQIIQGDWSGAWETIKETLSRVWDDIKIVVQTAIDSTKTIISVGWDAIKGATGPAWDGIKSTLSTAWDGIKSAASSAWDGIKGTITGVIDSIKGYFTALPGSLSSVGSDIISGIANAIANSADQIYDQLKKLAKDALQAARDALGIGSPSKLFADKVGAPISQGIVMGITGEAPRVELATRRAATAGVASAQGIANTYNQQRALTINYNGVANAPAMDYTTAMSLTGIS